MSEFARIMAEDRRLCVLRVLNGSTERRANHIVIQSILSTLGHTVSRDQIMADLAWLQELGLVSTDLLKGGYDCALMVAGLSTRGEDIATGRATVPGIKRPLPGDC